MIPFGVIGHKETDIKITWNRHGAVLVRFDDDGHAISGQLDVRSWAEADALIGMLHQVKDHIPLRHPR